MLVESPEGWRLGRVDDKQVDFVDLVDAVTETVSPEWADILASTLHSHGYDGKGLLVVLCSNNCLSATLVLEAASAPANRNEVAYDLEQHFPLAAEEFTADFLRHDDRLFAVAVATQYYRVILEGLEENGVSVQSVVPAGLILAQTLCNQVPLDERDGEHAIAWTSGDRIECVFWNADGATMWYLVDREPKALPRVLRWHQRESGRPIKVFLPEKSSLFPDSAGAHSEITFHSMQPFIAELVEGPVTEAVIGDAARSILSGKVVPWIELRRGGLGTRDPYRPIRSPLRFALSGIAALLLGLFALFWMRSEQYARITAEYQVLQSEMFRTTLPDQNIQAGFRDRLASELKRLSGVKGDAEGLPRRSSALTSLYDVLASLPRGLRCSFQEMRFEQEGVALDGMVRTHGDADVIASALRQRGYSVESPSTRVLSDKGIALRVTARRSRGE
ncbi:MAG TPA: hypothetical protein DD670_07845 [Planctomycetaceae bacterium]|nr:hypothetical protein [Planctomycetaceae bacterium]